MTERITNKLKGVKPPVAVLSAFGINPDVASVASTGSGLINHTWKITIPAGTYILQRVNEQVFRQPEDIAHNTLLLADHFRQNHPAYLFIAPVLSLAGSPVVYHEGYYRLFPFVEGSVCKDVAETPNEAHEAARQFGRFTRLLSDFDAGRLKTTIPAFHNLFLRYQQFLLALEKGNKHRIAESSAWITKIVALCDNVVAYNNICSDPEFKLRVTHHDTKISNVLFDHNGKALCVIDLDTAMPGHFISDVGDMMRTYLSPVSEEEKDFSKIQVRDEYYKAIVSGYYEEMKDELTEKEKDYFFYAGVFMIYMQAIRFMTDHISDDVYYGAKYPGHNLVRAGNQLTLLQRLLEKEPALRKAGV